MQGNVQKTLVYGVSLHKGSQWAILNRTDVDTGVCKGTPREHNYNLHSRLYTNDKNQLIIKPCRLAISTKDSQVKSH